MEKRRVLVVEDDPDFAGLLTTLLEDEGYGVVTAESALGAAELVRSVRPCAIMLDVSLPYRSGASLLEELKADPATAGIPVAVVTGLPDILTADRRRMAAVVVEKPIEVPALRGLVHDLCTLAP